MLPARSRMLLTLLLALTLGACSPEFSHHDWSPWVSKSETLRFLAPASCTTPSLLNPLDADAVFSKVKRLEPVIGRSWTFSAELVGERGLRRDRVTVSQRWTAAGAKIAPWEVTKDTQFCNVLAEIPVSLDGRYPYYVEPEFVKTREYQALPPVMPISLLLIAVVVAVLLLSFWGFEHNSQWGGLACFLPAILLVSMGAYFFCVEAPWEEYQKALAYLKFFDQLPRAANGELLPISPTQLAYLVAGPTHPSSTQFHFEVFAWISGSLIGTWLIMSSPFVVMGIYWLVVPLPLEELHKQTLREGRAPTAKEITNAVLSGCTGKAAWQHRIMQRKADAFARNLNNIAQHL